MNLGVLEEQNQRAIEHRNELLRLGTPPKPSDLVQLSKSYPYFGFVEVIIPTGESVLLYNNNDDFVALEIFWRKEMSYEPFSLSIWASLASNTSGIADIGAYSGLYSLVAAVSSPRATIHAFEAVDFIAARTYANAMLNGATRVIVHNAAVSDTSGAVELNIRFGPKLLSSGSRIRQEADRPPVVAKSVKSVRLDDVLSSSEIGLLKLDVEGAECQAFRGAVTLLRASRPAILVELLTEKSVSSFFHEAAPLGYHYAFISEGDRCLHSDLARFLSEPLSRNVLLVHADNLHANLNTSNVVSHSQASFRSCEILH